VLQSYFEENKSVKIIPAKDMMPYFILAGVFTKDIKNGLPIRNVLRRIDKNNQLHLIPYVHAERKEVNTNWFFQRSTSQAIDKSQPLEIKLKLIQLKEPKTNSRKDSDEHYVLDLCDEVLQIKGLRQHRFDFLLGDANAQGRKAKLPVDIYYPELKLVLEYKEQQHSKANKHFDKPDLFTLSGVHRGEQRKIYDQRRLEVLPQHGITVIEILYNDFKHDRKNKILRDYEWDLMVVRKLLE
jgi:very-short-patch-repair endonuclease